MALRQRLKPRRKKVHSYQAGEFAVHQVTAIFEVFNTLLINFTILEDIVNASDGISRNEGYEITKIHKAKIVSVH